MSAARKPRKDSVEYLRLMRLQKESKLASYRKIYEHLASKKYLLVHCVPIAVI